MANQANKIHVEQSGLDPIPIEQKQVRWYEYAMIQGALAINFGNFLIPAFAVLQGGLPIIYAVLATITGASLAYICVSILSIPGARYGVPAQYAIRSILGSHGARFISSPVRAINLLYWFSVQVIGVAFVIKEVSFTYFNIDFSFSFLAILLGSTIIILTLIGFDALKRTLKKFLSILIIGQLIILILFLKDFFVMNENITLLDNQTFTLKSFVFYASLAFVQFIAVVHSSSDITRYAKTYKHGFYGLLIGNFLGYSLVSVVGALSAGLYKDINPFLASIQLTESKILIAIILFSAVLSTVAINLNNAYSGAFSLLNSIPRLGRVKATIIFGTIAIILSLLPQIVNQAEHYISLLGLMVVPLGAVILVDYIWIKRGTLTLHSNSSMKQLKYNKIGIILVALGAISYYLIPDNYSPGFLIFILVSIIYGAIKKAINKRT